MKVRLRIITIAADDCSRELCSQAGKDGRDISWDMSARSEVEELGADCEYYV